MVPIDSSNEIVESPELSELEQFASFFHQDYELEFDSFYEGAQAYISILPEQRKTILKNELVDFIKAHDDTIGEMHENSTEMVQAWHELGAAFWESGLVMNQITVTKLR